MDRIIAVQPDGKRPRIIRAGIEVDRRADTRPLRAAIEKVLANEPASAEDPFVAGNRLHLVLYDRELDAAGTIAAALPLKQSLDASFNEGSRDFWLGVVARLKGDATAARAAFIKVRTKLEEELRIHPDNMGLLADLGLIDAALGRKQEALSEGRRAVELLPIAQEVTILTSGKSGMFGTCPNEVCVTRSFAMICAWAGERELSLTQLEVVTKVPGGPSYGELRLDPMWDPLRGDPRFEKIVSSLAPKE